MGRHHHLRYGRGDERGDLLDRERASGSQARESQTFTNVTQELTSLVGCVSDPATDGVICGRFALFRDEFVGLVLAVREHRPPPGAAPVLSDLSHQ